MTKEEFQKHALALYEFCEYPAVRYNILFSLLDILYRLGRFNRKKEIIGEKLNGWRVTCTKGCLIS